MYIKMPAFVKANLFSLFFAFLIVSCNTETKKQEDEATPTQSESSTIEEKKETPIETAKLKEKKNCSDAYSDADWAYTYANRAYNASSLSDAQSYARQAKSSFSDAARSARDCGCDDAYRQADWGETYANRAYNASSLSDAQSYARQAKGAADDTKNAARRCESEDK